MSTTTVNFNCENRTTKRGNDHEEKSEEASSPHLSCLLLAGASDSTASTPFSSSLTRLVRKGTRFHIEDFLIPSAIFESSSLSLVLLTQASSPALTRLVHFGGKMRQTVADPPPAPRRPARPSAVLGQPVLRPVRAFLTRRPFLLRLSALSF